MSIVSPSAKAANNEFKVAESSGLSLLDNEGDVAGYKANRGYSRAFLFVIVALVALVCLFVGFTVGWFTKPSSGTPQSTSVSELPSHTNAVSINALASTTPVEELVAVGTDYRIYRKGNFSSAWTQLPLKLKVQDIAQMQDKSFVLVGLDFALYYCKTLYKSCNTASSLVANTSQTIVSVDVLGDKKTLVGVGLEADKFLKTRTLAGPAWNIVPNSGSVWDITVLKDGSLLGVGMDWGLWTRTTLTASWIQIPNSGKVTRTAQLSDGSILGIGTLDALVYQRKNLTAPWILVDGSKRMLSVTGAIF
ncbi:UNVERIFIED_CONTAM: hypothetical protein HDU68_005142 [Siphonaria sp. JEL0065]|nr:hypothetical protein HDU68_005142 [Siphonaria sp. JEL0065]